MTSREKIESFLVRSSLTFEKTGEACWVVRDRVKGADNLIIMLVDTLVVMRTAVMAVPAAGTAALYEELLRLNATDMVHGAYALDGKNVIIIDTLEADGMDIEEFEASIDAIGLALAQHYRVLSRYRAAQ
jgi:hypothetical protein